ncbi:hypothetical protein [Leuconostoc citreum]|uniref:hypothetical protein n=1 Tax=Leuconostoc citreum TaxID=33964 RepID=UPI00105CB4C9|nr:hypothetical protein [Leuconostoc citreum]TDM36260.1 hypothetical protein CMW49_04180 [Leuconostoc citreum]TPF03047.1 hypothetical protein DIS11_04175 [Leuconostoc citreum]
MEEKAAVFFYKNFLGQNKYIATSSIRSGQGMDLMFSHSKEEFDKKVPKWNLGMYLLIDGTVFKL